MRYSHVSLSVRDRQRSTDWYCGLFGFTVLEELDEPDYTESVLVHPETGTVLCLQQHRANQGEPFDPRRTGGDHIAFRVDDRAELDGWQRLFEARGVRHTPVVDRDYGAVLCVRDPDEFQLELFYRVNHP